MRVIYCLRIEESTGGARIQGVCVRPPGSELLYEVEGTSVGIVLMRTKAAGIVEAQVDSLPTPLNRETFKSGKAPRGYFGVLGQEFKEHPAFFLPGIFPLNKGSTFLGQRVVQLWVVEDPENGGRNFLRTVRYQDSFPLCRTQPFKPHSRTDNRHANRQRLDNLELDAHANTNGADRDL